MKTLVFDIDDTLTTNGSWERLNAAAGVTTEEDYALYNAFKNKEIDYDTWTNRLGTLYREQGLLTRTIAEAALLNFTLRDGVTETIQLLKEHGHTIILLSGGFRLMAEAVAAQVGANQVTALSDLIFDDNNHFVDFVSQGEEGEAKLEALNGYCKRLSVDITSCIAVGDSINDIPLFKATGNGVTFTWCSETVKSTARYCIEDIRDFPPLLDIL
jgi:phosphoserine phosphatase